MFFVFILFGLLTKKDIAIRRCLSVPQRTAYKKKTLPIGDVFLARTSHKKRHCLSAMSFSAPKDCLQKKTLPIGDVISRSDFSQKKDIAFRRCLFSLGLLTKKRHCLSAMSFCAPKDFSQKKTLPIGDVFLLGARWDSNPRHSEPQSDALTN